MNDPTELTLEPSKLRGKGRARRAALMESAAKLFLEQGYERTSLDQIIGLAGGSKALLYREFGDKAGLFRAVMRELCENIFASFDADETQRSTGHAGAEPRMVLTELGHSLIKTLWGADVLALSRIVFTEGTRHPEVADIFFSLGYDASFERLGMYLSAVAKAPLEKDRAELLATLFLSMLQGDAFDRRLAGASRQRSAAELDQQVNLAVDWLLSQLGQ